MISAQPEPNDAAGIWQPQRRRLTAGLVLIVALTAFEALAVATALPAAIPDIGGVRFYGWAFSSFMLANLVGVTAAGDAADRSGAHRPFLLGCALFAIGLLAAGLSRGIVVFLIGRVLQGLGAGAIASASYVAVARAYPDDDKPRMLAVLSSAWVIPGIMGPAAAGALTHLFGWRSIFLCLIPLVAAAMLLAMRPLRHLPPVVAPATKRAARTGLALRLALGTGLALSAMEMRPPPLALVVLLAGVAIAAVAFRALMPAGVLRAEPGLPAAVAILAIVSASFFGAEAYVPLSLTLVRGQTPLVAGAALTAATLLWTVGTWVQERRATRTSRRALTRVGLLIMLAGIAGTSTVLAVSVPIEIGPLTWGLAGLGIGIAYPTAMLVALESAQTGREGEASAATQLAGALGAALGTGVGGGLLALATAAGYPPALGIAPVFALAVAFGSLGIVAVRGLPGIKPKVP